MWLTTPRMLAAVAALAAVLVGVAWAEADGLLDHDVARVFYGAACILLLAAIVYRARARWRAWKDRQP